MCIILNYIMPSRQAIPEGYQEIGPTKWRCLTENPWTLGKITALVSIILLYAVATYLSVNKGTIFLDSASLATFQTCEYLLCAGFIILMIALCHINHKNGSVFPCTVPHFYKDIVQIRDDGFPYEPYLQPPESPTKTER
jgi:hypothetical protein